MASAGAVLLRGSVIRSRPLSGGGQQYVAGEDVGTDVGTGTRLVFVPYPANTSCVPVSTSAQATYSVTPRKYTTPRSSSRYHTKQYAGEEAVWACVSVTVRILRS